MTWALPAVIKLYKYCSRQAHRPSSAERVCIVCHVGDVLDAAGDIPFRPVVRQDGVEDGRFRNPKRVQGISIRLIVIRDAGAGPEPADLRDIEIIGRPEIEDMGWNADGMLSNGGGLLRLACQHGVLGGDIRQDFPGIRWPYQQVGFNTLSLLITKEND